MSFIIKTNGGYLPGIVKDISQELNGMESAVIELENNISTREFVASDKPVEIYWGGTQIFVGTLQKIIYSEQEDSRLTCTAFDTVYDKLDKKSITAVYDASDDSDDIESIVAAIATAGGVSSSCALTGSTYRRSIRFNKTSCMDAVKFVAQAGNTDYYTTGGTTIVVGARGTARGSVPVLSVSRSAVDRHVKRDKIEIRGFDKDGHELTGTAGAGTNVTTYTEYKASDQTTLDQIAAYKLTNLNKDSSGISLKISMGYAYAFLPGDTLTLTRESLNLNGTYRIFKITKRGDVATVEIDVPEALLEKYLSSQKQAEDLGIYTGTALLDLPVGAPIAPNKPTITSVIDGIQLSWVANTEADMNHYTLYRHTTAASGSATKIADVGGTTYLDMNKTYGQYYFYWLKAIDNTDHISPYGIVESGKAKRASGVNIAPSSIATNHLQDSLITNSKILAGAVTELKIAASAVSANKIATDAIVTRTIAAGQITTVKIGNDQITSPLIAASTIESANIKAGAILATNIGALQVTTTAIAASAVTAAKITAGAITSNKIYASAVTANKIAASSIDAFQIKANAITSNKIYASSVTANKIAASSIDAFQIRANAITSNKIYASAVTSAKITAGAITANKIAASSISSNMITTNAITLTKMGSNSVDGTKITASSINTNHIRALAITAGKIAASSISTNLIQLGAINGTKITASSINTNHIITSAITIGKMGTGSVGGTQLTASSVTSAKISAGAITSNKIYASAVTANKIAASSISAFQIAANAITSNKIYASAITSAKITAGAITTNKIAASSIATNMIQLGSVNGTKITASSINTNHIITNAITIGKMGTGSVGSTQLTASSVTTAKITANAINANKIAASAVTSNKIYASSIVAGKIATNAIEAVNILAGAITSDKITANNIYGKSFATKSGVGRAGAGAGTGIRFFSSGIIFYSSGARKRIELSTAVGARPKMLFYGSGTIEMNNTGGTREAYLGHGGYVFGSGLEIWADAGKLISFTTNAGQGGMYIQDNGTVYLRNNNTFAGGTGSHDFVMSGGTIKATNISGASITSHFRDAFWRDLICPKCDEAFRPGETLGMYVKAVEHSEIRTVPAHLFDCTLKIR